MFYWYENKKPASEKQRQNKRETEKERKKKKQSKRFIIAYSVYHHYYIESDSVVLSCQLLLLFFVVAAAVVIVVIRFLFIEPIKNRIIFRFYLSKSSGRFSLWLFVFSSFCIVVVVVVVIVNDAKVFFFVRYLFVRYSSNHFHFLQSELNKYTTKCMPKKMSMHEEDEKDVGWEHIYREQQEIDSIYFYMIGKIYKYVLDAGAHPLHGIFPLKFMHFPFCYCSMQLARSRLFDYSIYLVSVTNPISYSRGSHLKREGEKNKICVAHLDAGEIREKRKWKTNKFFTVINALL